MITEDPKDPRLTHGSGDEPVDQASVYLVLSEEERAKGFVRPVRRSYVHLGSPANPGCGAVTHMGAALCETYARDPGFYGSTYCVGCCMHRPVMEFVWSEDGKGVGTRYPQVSGADLTSAGRESPCDLDMARYLTLGLGE